MVAGRLAEADPNLSILLIEQGPDNYGVPEIVYVNLIGRTIFRDMNP